MRKRCRRSALQPHSIFFPLRLVRAAPAQIPGTIRKISADKTTTCNVATNGLHLSHEQNRDDSRPDRTQTQERGGGYSFGTGADRLRNRSPAVPADQIATGFAVCG